MHSTPKNDIRSSQDRDMQEQEKNESIDQNLVAKNLKVDQDKRLTTEEQNKQDAKDTETAKTAAVKKNKDKKISTEELTKNVSIKENEDKRISIKEQIKQDDIPKDVRPIKSAVIKENDDKNLNTIEQTKQDDIPKDVKPIKSTIIKENDDKRTIIKEQTKQDGAVRSVEPIMSTALKGNDDKKTNNKEQAKQDEIAKSAKSVGSIATKEQAKQDGIAKSIEPIASAALKENDDKKISIKEQAKQDGVAKSVGSVASAALKENEDKKVGVKEQIKQDEIAKSAKPVESVAIKEQIKQDEIGKSVAPEKNIIIKENEDKKISVEEQIKQDEIGKSVAPVKNIIIKENKDNKINVEEQIKQNGIKKIVEPEKNIIVRGDLDRKISVEEQDTQIGIKKTRLYKVEKGMEPEQAAHYQDPLLMRRMRVNRIIMRKRRQERFCNGIGPRLVTAGFILLAIVMILLSSSVGGAYAYYQSQLPLLDGIAQHSLFQTTHIYDRNGKLLYELYDKQLDHGRRTYVNYDDISPLIVNATVAAEDHTFWTNTGVDYTGIVRAAVSNAQSNSVVEGGSTITQQLIKKQFFADQPRNVQVKSEEAVLATGLTQQYPKWKIMEMYLNTVFYGDNNFGIEAAAEEYFGLKPQCSQGHCKPAVAQLTLGQASLLAGLPQSPTSYMPVTYKTRALQRQSIVLQSMENLNMISARQKAQAQKEMQQYQFKGYQPVRVAPHFVDYVVDDVLNLFGAQNVANGGYNIYTTLDLDLEQKVEQLTYDHLYKDQVDAYLGYGTLSQFHNVNNAAVVVTNPVNGEILAMNGSADYNMTSPQVQGQYNAALSPRQPGSSFKPIVYATAFEMGWYPAMIVPDQQTYFPLGTNTYSPHNYDNKYNHPGPMTVRKAVANSFNVPAIEAIEYTGIPNVLNMAGRLGLSEIQDLPLSQTGPAMALGAKETSLLHLTGAYATFANKGVRVPTVSILKINDNQGHTIYQYDEAHPYGQRAVREDISFLISSILSDKVARYEEFGPNNPLELSIPAAAKTGTTENYADNWTMGYTPHLTVGVWAGNSNNELMRDVIGITGAAPIWHDVMEYATQRYHLPPDDFTPPADVHQKTVSAITGLAAQPGEPTVQDWFIDGTQPTISGIYYAPPAPGPVKQKHHDNNGGNNNNNGN